MPAQELPQGNALTDKDLDFLRDIYESAASNYQNIDDETRRATARILVRHYRAGQHERYALVSLAESRFGRGAG